MDPHDDQPAYLEHDRETRVVIDPGLPMDHRVLTITDMPDGGDVTLHVSAAIRHLARTHVRYDLFLGRLRELRDHGGRVFVTEDSVGRGVIDVRPAW